MAPKSKKRPIKDATVPLTPLPLSKKLSAPFERHKAIAMLVKELVDDSYRPRPSAEGAEEEEEEYDENEALAAVLSDVTSYLAIPDSVMKKARLAHLASSSQERWQQVQDTLKLADTIPEETTPFNTYLLPPSLLQAILHRTYKALQVYRLGGPYSSEANSVRLIETCMVDIASLFDGRIENRAVAAMEGNDITTGGAIQYEYFILRGCLFFVVEAKKTSDLAASNDSKAQLFVEMYSAAKLNAKFYGLADGIALDLPVFGLLTSLDYNVFYKYDPIKSEFFECASFGGSVYRDSVIYTLVPVCNYIFTILIMGYKNALQIAIKMHQDETAGKKVHKNTKQLDVLPNLLIAASTLHEALGVLDQATVEMACSDPGTLGGEEICKKGLKLLNDSVNYIKMWDSGTKVFSAMVTDPPHSDEEVSSLIKKSLNMFYDVQKSSNSWKKLRESLESKV